MPEPKPYSHVVRFSQVDAAGIMFFSRVFEICHEAFEATLVAGGAPLASIIQGQGWAAPLVHAEADYRRPMRLGDRLLVRVEVAALTARKLTFRFVVSGEEGDLRATVEHVHAFVDLSVFKGREVHPDFTGALERAGLALPAPR